MPMSSAQRFEPKLRAMVIGCGRIGGLNDESREGESPITHAGSFATHPGFDLVACIEPDDARRATFMRRWTVQHGFCDLASFCASGIDVDVVSLCTPSDTHDDYLRTLLDSPMKLMFCEKPLTTKLDTSREIAAAYIDADRPLAVNYTRRWNQTLRALRDEIASGKWGHLISGSGFYTKGILNNGSHLVDLLLYLFGKVDVVATTGIRIDDDADDPTLDAVLRTANGAAIHIVGGDARAFYMFELTMVMEYGVIALEAAGSVLRTRRRITSPLGEAELGSSSVVETEWRRQFLCALDNIHDAVTRGAPLLSDASSAVAAQTICADLKKRARSTSGML
jgi:predicted dehydrogenase